MHVLLIHPSQYKDGINILYGELGAIEHPPLGLAMLGAVLLEAGFEVDLIDMDAEHLTAEQIIKTIGQKQTKLVGLSATTPIFKNAVRLAEAIKKSRPEVKICVGGYHPSMDPLGALAEPGIDYVVKGEGERTIVELAQAVQAGAAPEQLRGIKGLYFKDEGRLVANPEREPIMDLDSLPMPARHLFANHRYTYPDTKYLPVFPIFTSRGCPGKCTFCQQQNISGRKLRVRSASKVVDEMELLIKKYGAREIHILDDMFACDKRHVFEIRDELARRKIKIPIAFPIGIRVDSASREVLEAMRAMGGYSIAFGVESGSQEILDRAKKGVTLQEIREALATAKAVGFETWCFFMFGLLGETKETIEQTIRFAIELDPDVSKFHIVKPYPGSEFHRELKQMGLIQEFDPERYSIHTFPVHRTEALSS
jgi:anaerobic magnesium-protoporphyrin IX monomethyl ester cyclase